MKALGIDKAHLCRPVDGRDGRLEFAIRHPGKATALVIAAGGGGGSSDPGPRSASEECEAFAQRIEREGMPAMAELYCAGSARVHLSLQGPARLGRVQAAVRRRLGERPRHDHARRPGRAPAVLRAHGRAAADRRADAGDHRRRGRFDARPRRASQAHVPRSACSKLPEPATRINLEEPAAFNAAVAGLPPRRRARPLGVQRHRRRRRAIRSATRASAALHCRAPSRGFTSAAASVIFDVLRAAPSSAGRYRRTWRSRAAP